MMENFVISYLATLAGEYKTSSKEDTFEKFDTETGCKLFGDLTRENDDGLYKAINVKVKHLKESKGKLN